MKKLPLLCVAALLVSLTSCKKSYKCECTTDYDGDKVVTNRSISKTTKKTAEAICGDYSQTETYQAISGTGSYSETYNTSCVLK